jgi:hypothetical protein
MCSKGLSGFMLLYVNGRFFLRMLAGCADGVAVRCLKFLGATDVMPKHT